MSRRILGFVFGLFTIAGGGLSIALGAGELLEARAARHWVETPCVIIESEARLEGDTRRVHVIFEYEHDGRRFRSERYRFVDLDTGDSSWQESVARRLPAGKETVCHVDPSDPASAVLVRDPHAAMYWLLLPVGLAALGAAGLTVLLVGGLLGGRAGR